MTISIQKSSQSCLWPFTAALAVFIPYTSLAAGSYCAEAIAYVAGALTSPQNANVKGLMASKRKLYLNGYLNSRDTLTLSHDTEYAAHIDKMEQWITEWRDSEADTQVDPARASTTI